MPRLLNLVIVIVIVVVFVGIVTITHLKHCHQTYVINNPVHIFGTGGGRVVTDVCSPLLSSNHGKEEEEEVRGAKVRCRGGGAGRRCRTVDETFFWRSRGVAGTGRRSVAEIFFWTSLHRGGGV